MRSHNGKSTKLAEINRKMMKFNYNIMWYSVAEQKRCKQKEIPILNGKYPVKFVIDCDSVYIADFKSAGQNSY